MKTNYTHLNKQYRKKFPYLLDTMKCEDTTTVKGCAITRHTTSLACQWNITSSLFSKTGKCEQDKRQLITIVSKLKKSLHVPEIPLAYIYAYLGNLDKNDETISHIHGLPLQAQALLVIYFHSLCEQNQGACSAYITSMTSDEEEIFLKTLVSDVTKNWNDKILAIQGIVAAKLKRQKKNQKEKPMRTERNSVWPRISSGFIRRLTLMATVVAVSSSGMNVDADDINGITQALVDIDSKVPNIHGTSASPLRFQMLRTALKDVESLQWDKIEDNTVLFGSMIRNMMNDPRVTNDLNNSNNPALTLANRIFYEDMQENGGDMPWVSIHRRLLEKAVLDKSLLPDADDEHQLAAAIKVVKDSVGLTRTIPIDQMADMEWNYRQGLELVGRHHVNEESRMEWERELLGKIQEANSDVEKLIYKRQLDELLQTNLDDNHSRGVYLGEAIGPETVAKLANYGIAFTFILLGGVAYKILKQTRIPKWVNEW
jgi:hypothetical protein